MVKSPNGFPVQSPVVAEVLDPRRRDFDARPVAPPVVPYVAIANRQAEIMMRIACEFGFTPASRSRIAAPTETEPDLFDFEQDKGGS